MIQDIELLKEIKESWNTFSRLVFIIEQIYSFIIFPSIFDTAEADKEHKEIKENLEVTIQYINDNLKFIKEFDIKKIENCINDIEELLKHEKYEELKKKMLKEKEKQLIQFLKWFKQNQEQLYKIIDYLHSNTPYQIIESWAEFRKTREKYMSIFYDYEDLFEKKRIINLNNFIYELDALLRTKTMQVKNYELAKEICQKKIIDIYTPGLLIHNTRSSLYNWNTKAIARFIQKGIESENKGYGLFKGMVSFYMITKTMAKRNYMHEAAFIIDPAFVRENNLHFHYNPYVTNSEEFLELCEKMKIQQKQRKRNEMVEEMVDEVQSDISIPFNAIYGIVLIGERFDIRNRIIFFMNKLIKNHPELAFPIYDLQGNVVWPE